MFNWLCNSASLESWAWSPLSLLSHCRGWELLYTKPKRSSGSTCSFPLPDTYAPLFIILLLASMALSKRLISLLYSYYLLFKSQMLNTLHVHVFLSIPSQFTTSEDFNNWKEEKGGGWLKREDSCEMQGANLLHYLVFLKILPAVFPGDRGQVPRKQQSVGPSLMENLWLCVCVCVCVCVLGRCSLIFFKSYYILILTKHSFWKQWTLHNVHWFALPVAGNEGEQTALPWRNLVCSWGSE